jgi:hypothetical protein
MAELRCDFCADNLAEFIVGNIETGEQQLACRFDFARLGLAIARAVLPPEEWQAPAALLLDPIPNLPEDGAAVAPPSKRRTRKPASKHLSHPITQALAAESTAIEDE